MTMNTPVIMYKSAPNEARTRSADLQIRLVGDRRLSPGNALVGTDALADLEVRAPVACPSGRRLCSDRFGPRLAWGCHMVAS